MNTDFAPVMAALLTHLQFNTVGFRSWSPRLKYWGQVADQPAGFVRRIGTADEFSGEMPVTTLDCEVWIYARTDDEDPDGVPDAELCRLDKQVRDALAAGPTDDDMRQTLGGLVYWCRIEGSGDYTPDDQSGQGISKIPVRITLP